MRDQVEEVKSKIDIVDIIGEYVDLKKSGTNFKGLCPFHNEKSPSFMVNPELQIYKCFGCGEGGDVFSFLEKQEGMSFIEALQLLAKKSGIELVNTNQTHQDIKPRLYEVSKLVHSFYQYMLWNHKSGEEAMRYLKQERGLKDEIIKYFEIGYAPNDYHALEHVLIRKKRATSKELEEIGMIYLRDGRPQDRFRGRIMFPLYNHRGDLQGFSGRILPQLDTKTAGKYINSPETVLYHKGRNLFGLWFTRKAIKQKGYAVLVEGPLDAIASYQAGVTNVAAIQGTSLTEEQVQLLSRFTKKIVFSLDSDFAGDNAERKGIRIAEDAGMEIRVARLVGYKDPGEAAISDPKLYVATIRDAEGVWDFIIDSVFNKYKTIDGENKASISRELIPLLGSIDDSIVRNHYTIIASKKLGVAPEAVASEVSRYSANPKAVFTPIKTVEKIKPRRELLEERLLSLSFLYRPTYLFSENLLSFIETQELRQLLVKYISFFNPAEQIDLKKFAGSLEDTALRNKIEELVLMQWDDIDKKSQEEYNTELDRVRLELELLSVRSQLDTIAGEVKSLQGNAKKQKLLQAQKQYQYLQKLQSQLDRK